MQNNSLGSLASVWKLNKNKLSESHDYGTDRVNTTLVRNELFMIMNFAIKLSSVDPLGR